MVNDIEDAGRPTRPVVVPDPAAYGVRLPAGLLSGRFEPTGGEAWDRHVHPDHHELLWDCRGGLTVEIERGTFAVPSTLAIWIAAGVDHAVSAAPGASFWCTFFHSSLGSPIGADIAAIDVPPAAEGLLRHLSSAPIEDLADHRRAEQVIVGLLRPLDVTPPMITLPSDPLLRQIAQRIIDDPSERCTIEHWGARVGASARTIARGFTAETGMSFGRWRTQVRIRLALPRLAAGEPVSTVARAVGYRSASAFVRVFRREIGATPGSFHETVASRSA